MRASVLVQPPHGQPIRGVYPGRDGLSRQATSSALKTALTPQDADL